MTACIKILIYIFPIHFFISSYFARILPEDSFLNIDGISIAPAYNHLCALESTRDAYMGGVVKCWGIESDENEPRPPLEVNSCIMLYSYANLYSRQFLCKLWLE